MSQKYKTGDSDWKLIRDRLLAIFRTEKDSSVVDQVFDKKEIQKLLIDKL